MKVYALSDSHNGRLWSFWIESSPAGESITLRLFSENARRMREDLGPPGITAITVGGISLALDDEVRAGLLASLANSNVRPRERLNSGFFPSRSRAQKKRSPSHIA